MKKGSRIGWCGADGSLGDCGPGDPPDDANDEDFDNSELEWDRYLKRDPITGDERP